jgi:hypothetical protein
MKNYARTKEHDNRPNERTMPDQKKWKKKTKTNAPALDLVPCSSSLPALLFPFSPALLPLGVADAEDVDVGPTGRRVSNTSLRGGGRLSESG